MQTAPEHKSKTFREAFITPLAYPLAAVILMWAVHLIGIEFSLNLSKFGLKPRDAEGLLGIFTMPFLHGGFEHLSNNSGPILVLGWATFKFYREIAWKSILGIWLISGIWLWVSGRDAYHIGASGMVYGLAAFLFLSGWLRRERAVAGLSLAIVFIYGSLWWGVLPVDPKTSWEGHLWGAAAGITMAIYLRKKGPQRPLYQWEKDEILEKKRDQLAETIEFEIVGVEEGPLKTSDSAQRKTPHQKGGASRDENISVNYNYRPSDRRSGKGREG